MLLSIIVPVYNRPEELDDLLRSLSIQSFKDYELIIVEDGSTIPSGDIVESYRSSLPGIRYLYIPNSGPSVARNVGAKQAIGDYLLILDSDVVLPPFYLQNVVDAIRVTQADAFGGPDAAAPDFTNMQKAVNYAMTSFFTTGGIRGGSASTMEDFKPRTFNMGCRRDLFLSLNGFAEDMRYGEDIDFSLRLIASGAIVKLFPQSFVFHKRRVDLDQFFWQVHHSGEARVELEKRHPGSTKFVHYLPALFTLYCLLSIISIVGTTLLLLYSVLLFCDAWLRTRSFYTACLSVIASFVQLIGYGTGFLKAKLLH